MGGSPSAPTVVMPPPAQSTIYESRNPKEAYQALADYGKRLYDQTQVATSNLQAQSGTPQQIGQKMLDRDALTAASYASSLPQEASPDLKQTANDLMQKAKAKAAAGAPAPAPTPAYETPSWVYGPDRSSLG